jgi:dTDP-4-dehydrorhamnose reductase
MSIPIDVDSLPPLQLWGGLEATVNRVRDRYFSQMEQNGHDQRISDLDRFAALGITALRYPVLWELIAPDGLEQADWSWPDERLPALRELGITPIAGLVHHGSGPRHTSLVDPGFAEQLADYAGAVARRYPWLEYYTPVNEPCTTARFSGLYGLWYPHEESNRSFVRALLNQCRGVVLAMQAIRAVNPAAKLVQTDDLGKTYSTPEMATTAEFYNQRRWLPWDLLCGMVDAEHALWGYLCENGASRAELDWFRQHPCPPDIIGVNYYITSERWLDHRTAHFPAGEIGPEGYADVVAARALTTPRPGIGPLLEEAWHRYGLPLAVTEAHIDAPREDHLRWLWEIWHAAQHARQRGVEVRAVTVWSLLGSYDWNCLVTECKGYYETGAYDLRSPEPRPTALATLMQELASDRPPSSPVLQGNGWWRRPERLLYPPSDIGDADHWQHHAPPDAPAQPLLITGANGTLGSAFARLCAARHLDCHVLTRQEMDITDPAAVETAICRYRPWAIINAGGYAPLSPAGHDAQRCLRDNVLGPIVLAAACARHAVGLLNFSSDQVFDGAKGGAYVESDAVSPANVYGHNKAEAERRVHTMYPPALTVRTSALFGPWDQRNFIIGALRAQAAGQQFSASDDLTSPTYIPDLVHACLDLLIDRESGIWHLSNQGAISWAQLAQQAATLAGVDNSVLTSGADARPAHCTALASERGQLMPPLDDALRRYLQEVEVF